MQGNQAGTEASAKLLREIYKIRWRTYRSELKRCQDEVTEEAVHDLRVATRRLLALIDLLRAVAPHPRLRKLRRTLKDQLNDLNGLRDTQVMLIAVSESLDDFPEIEFFQKFLHKREKRLLRSTGKAIKSFKHSGFSKRMATIRKKILKKKLNTVPDSQLLQAADDQFGVVLHRYHHVDPSNPATIHRMRVAFKKFRYIVEIIRPLIPTLPEENLNPMHDYQSAMGNIQDAEVMLSTFQDFAERDVSYNPASVLQYYEQRHSKIINAFIEDMHQVNIFWRSTPEDVFPWETGKNPTSESVGAGSGHENDENGEQDEAESEARESKDNFSVQ